MVGNTALIKASNAIIEGTYNLSLLEQKLLAFVILSIRADKKHSNFVNLDLKEVRDVLKLEKSKGATGYMQHVYKKMVGKILEFRSYSGTKIITQWFSSLESEFDDGHVVVEIPNVLIPYFINLKTRFTSWELRYVIALRSKYAYRIYLILKRYAYEGSHIFDIDNFYERVNVPNSYRKHFGLFNIDVLTPSVKDINELTDIEVTIEAKKRSRKVVALQFLIVTKGKERTVDPDNIKRLVNVGVSAKKAKWLLERYPMKPVLSDVLKSAAEQLGKGILIDKMDAYFTQGSKERYQPKGTPYKSSTPGEQGIGKLDSSGNPGITPL